MDMKVVWVLHSLSVFEIPILIVPFILIKTDIKKLPCSGQQGSFKKNKL
ncbi:hypothetical protein [Tenuibacillus multivorans]|nr:hypothetical protein [Tenuibacillus multivorans]GEL76405.1 hypothetical protein TMU01_06400 [Tenuibacillus multivorans]